MKAISPHLAQSEAIIGITVETANTTGFPGDRGLMTVPGHLLEDAYMAGAFTLAQYWEDEGECGFDPIIPEDETLQRYLERCFSISESLYCDDSKIASTPRLPHLQEHDEGGSLRAPSYVDEYINSATCRYRAVHIYGGKDGRRGPVGVAWKYVGTPI